MDVVAIIPATSGSTDVPGGAARPFAGRPLITHSIEQARQSARVGRTVVATDDGEIARIAGDWGAEVIRTIDELERIGRSPDFTVLLAPACPLRTPEMIDGAIDHLRDRDGDSLVSVHRSPGVLWVEDENGAAMPVDDGAAAVTRLVKDQEAARTRYREAADRLSRARGEAAGGLDTRVAAELEPLRLGKARFVTAVAPLDENDWGEHGRGRVVFEVATNPGVPPGPLARIASGGELARFMLALKVVLARADPVPTLIFDEVDAGIGGAVAAAVGERLAMLADEVQVLVLTHSPQVAARGSHHWRVSKTAGDADARTLVQVLDETGRKEEIARMLAGTRITAEARAAAESLLLGGAA